MTPSNENSLVYIPCKFNGFTNGITKVGSVSKSVDKNTGAPKTSNGVIAENDDQTTFEVSKMVASAMV
jgi:hypothetical protein